MTNLTQGYNLEAGTDYWPADLCHNYTEQLSGNIIRFIMVQISSFMSDIFV